MFLDHALEGGANVANVMYGKGRQAFVEGLSWASGTFKVVGVTAGYVFSAAHNFLSDVTAGNRVFTTAALSGKTEPAGVLDAADVLQSAVSGSTVVALILYHDTGVEATSELIAYYDTGTNLPFPPNTGDVQILWDNGANKVLAI